MAALLTGIERELDAIAPYLDELETFIEALFKDPGIFSNGEHQVQKNKNRIENSGRPRPKKPVRSNEYVSKEETLKKFNLEELFRTEKINLDIKSIFSFLLKKRQLASTFIHLYTGMRHSEVKVMPYCCYQEISIPGFSTASIILSHTKKLVKTHYSELLPWVSSPVVYKAVKVAQAIARMAWIKNCPDPFPSDHATVPLWLAMDWKRADEPVQYEYPISDIGKFQARLPEGLEGTKIEQADIEELVAFDAFRGWDEDPAFEVGKMWPFTTHQARRSVAVYASRSGMVSLPGLSTQFKHMTLVMTALYSENSGFAESFILNEDGSIPDEFGVLEEFRDAKRFNASIAFEEQVINSQSQLLGGRGKLFQIEKDRNMPVFLESSKSLKERIQRGEVRSVPLPTGGICQRETGPCESYGVDWTFPCYGCPDSVFSDDVLEAAAESLSFAMKEMSLDSLAYKFSSERLNLIKSRLNN